MMTAIALNEPSQIAHARRHGARLAATAGLDADAAARLALVVTEAATNALRHGGGGEVLLGADPGAAEPTIDLLVLDRGPGISNVQACLADGVSTTASAGNGLGAILRMSDHADIYAPPGRGTIVHARFGPGRCARPGRDVGGVAVAAAGETASGDVWALRRFADSWSLMVCDGLGHGPAAAEVAAAARRTFAGLASDRPAEIVGALHDALRGTRGAVAAVATFRPAERVVRYAGIGNIAAWLRGDGGEQRPLAVDGIVGYGAARPREQEFAYDGRLIAVLHSDGVSARWDLESYPGLATRGPIVIAAALHRDFRRPRDDSAVVVVKVEA